MQHPYPPSFNAPANPTKAQLPQLPPRQAPQMMATAAQNHFPSPPQVPPQMMAMGAAGAMNNGGNSVFQGAPQPPPPFLPTPSSQQSMNHGFVPGMAPPPIPPMPTTLANNYNAPPNQQLGTQLYYQAPSAVPPSSPPAYQAQSNHLPSVAQLSSPAQMPQVPQLQQPYHPSQPHQLHSPTGAYPQEQLRHIDLLQERALLSHGLGNNPVQLPGTVANPDVHCDPGIFRCSLTAIPDTPELLSKCRLPFGITLQPFRDVPDLEVMQVNNIARCRYCRTYLNPYVFLPDARRWKCNVCYKINDLPEEICWDADRRCYDPTSRPEFHCPTIEFIAPSEYMLRPPQPPLYMFLFDVGATAVDIGYLHTFSEQLLLSLDLLPGEDRALIGFIGVDSALHFFQFTVEGRAPRQLIVNDIEETYAPSYDGLVVPLRKFKESIRTFVQSLPSLYDSSTDGGSCMGAALTVAKNLIEEVGGRITVLTATAPNTGPGALGGAIDPSSGHSTAEQSGQAGGRSERLSTNSDFYKRLALECTGRQIAIDLFLLGSRQMDVATLADACKFSAGSLYHFNGFHFVREQREVKRFQKAFNRYLTRKIGFEAVLRIRCSRGLSLHSFYGNFFIRSTDLLTLANVSPDLAVGAQLMIDEKLGDDRNAVIFQAALLYTSSKGDRRIRVHTLCLPVTSDASVIFNNLDIKATVSLLGKMAVERAMTGTELNDCREALVNAASDALHAYNKSVGQRAQCLLVPVNGQLKFFVLFVLGLLKQRAFSSASKGRLPSVDRRVVAMMVYRSAPLELILLETCPLLFAVDEIDKVDPQRLPLSYEHFQRHGVYLMDTGSWVYLYVRCDASAELLKSLFGVNSFTQIDEDECSLEERDNPLSQRLHLFLRHLQSLRGGYAPVRIIREDSHRREIFTQRLIEDRTESTHSYIEFLQHVKREINTS